MLETIRTFAAAALIAAAAALPAAAQELELGEDGLYKPDWLRITFKDMAEDLEAAREEGKRLVVIFEQRGCIYCKKLHEEVLSDPEVRAYIEANYFFVQMNMFGDEEVTDFDGEALPEKDMARRWGLLFTPTLMFMPEEAPESGTAAEAAVAVMPGAFGKWTVLNMLTWVRERGYESDEVFQKYHARMLKKQLAGG